MAPGRKQMPVREVSVSRGPSGVTVFIVFLLLAALCLGAGFTIGHYILATLGDKIGDNGDAPPPDDGSGGSGGDDGGSGGGEPPGDGGSSGGGAVPAGGGQGTITWAQTPLTVYFVQVGAFGARANADKAATDLAAKGYPGYVLQPAAGSNLYKVRAVTLTRKDVADSSQSRLKSQGYSDCFVAGEILDPTPATLSGSSVDYLNKVKAGLDAVVNCLRSEGGIWDKDRGGGLDRTAAAATADSLIAAVDSAKTGLASLIAPQDLAALGQAVDEQLTAARANLTLLKTYLSSQTAADRLQAEISYASLVDAYARLAASLR